MSACSASNRMGLRPCIAWVAVLALFALGAAGPAMARRLPADTTVKVSVGPIDVGAVHLRSSRGGGRTMHVKGDLNVNGEHIELDHDVQVDVPRLSRMPRVPRVPHDSEIPGIHIESDDESIVRMASDIEIDSLEVVADAVVALFGNVTVHGHVGGDVVAVLGSVTLAPGAIVEGDAVAVGGSLEQSPEATVHGKSVSLSFLPIRDGMPPLRALAIAVFAAWLLAMFMGALLVLLFPGRLVVIAQTISERTGWSLLFGLLLPPLAVIAAVLLIVTMIGIPVAVLLPLVYLFALWAGTVAATLLLGSRLMRRPLGRGLAGPLFAGTLTLGVLFGFGATFTGMRGILGTLACFFPLLGMLLVLSLSVIGSGAVLVSRFGSGPKLVPPAPPAG